MKKRFAIFTEESAFMQEKIHFEDAYGFGLEEYTEDAAYDAKEQGKKFVHFFEEKEGDYDQTYYEYLNSEILA
ncbi:hypothetical protein ACE106_17555 [Shouchella clausii]|uniref:hypothetical protein n=1 Tax=Shouchella clausii TaxID=79880 RepID=UPI00289AF9D8|nr:hypothetical protein [Shouchella clausii]